MIICISLCKFNIFFGQLFLIIKIFLIISHHPFLNSSSLFFAVHPILIKKKEDEKEGGYAKRILPMIGVISSIISPLGIMLLQEQLRVLKRTEPPEFPSGTLLPNREQTRPTLLHHFP